MIISNKVNRNKRLNDISILRVSVHNCDVTFLLSITCIE